MTFEEYYEQQIGEPWSALEARVLTRLQKENPYLYAILVSE